MRTVTGKIISSTPVSISKAASVLSKFVSKDTGASPAICAYLRRTAAAFDELARLDSKSGSRKHKKHKSDAWKTSSRPVLTHGVEEGKGDGLVDECKTVNNVKEEQSQAETEQKKKEEEEEKAEIGNAGSLVDNGAEEEGNRLVEKGKTVNKVKEGQSQAATEQKKKDKNKKFEIGNADNFLKNGGEVVDRKEDGVKVQIKEKEEKNGGKIGIDVEKMDEKNKKKRKNRDVEEEEKDGSQDHQSKKKKKRRKQSGEVDN